MNKGVFSTQWPSTLFINVKNNFSVSTQVKDDWMTVIKQQMFGTNHYIELLCALNITIALSDSNIIEQKLGIKI